MEGIISPIITNILDSFETIVVKYKYNKNEINNCEKEIKDLLHEIELSKNKNAYDGFKMYEKLREVTRRRRQCLDENKELKELYNYYINNKEIKNKLIMIKNNNQVVLNNMKNRKYKAKVREDLTIATKTSTQITLNNTPAINTTNINSCISPKKKFENMMRNFTKQQHQQRKYRYL
jgi:hypothetical protein